MKVMARTITGATIALALVLFLSPASAQDDSLPSFRVDNPSLELDKVFAGHTVTATWVFRNDGPNDVHIIRAKPS